MANYYTYDPANPSVVYPMKADKFGAIANPMDGKNPNAKGKRRCPKCARKMSKRKQVCKCGYVKPAVPSQAGYRLFALLFLIFAALAIVVIPYYSVDNMKWDTTIRGHIIDVKNGSLLSLLTGMLASGEKLFGFIPALTIGHGGEINMLYTFSVYAFLLCGALAVFYALFAALSRDKAAKRARRALFFMGIGALLYSVSFTVCLNSFETTYATIADLPKGLFLSVSSYVIDFFSAFAGVGSVIASFVLWRVAKHPAKVAKKLAKKEAKKAKKCKCR